MKIQIIFILSIFFILKIISLKHEKDYYQINSKNEVIKENIYSEKVEYLLYMNLKHSYEKCRYNLDCIERDYQNKDKGYFEYEKWNLEDIYTEYFENYHNIDKYDFSPKMYKKIDFDYLLYDYNRWFEPIYYNIRKICYKIEDCIYEEIFKFTIYYHKG
jgi:hypothetical protein